MIIENRRQTLNLFWNRGLAPINNKKNPRCKNEVPPKVGQIKLFFMSKYSDEYKLKVVRT